MIRTRDFLGMGLHADDAVNVEVEAEMEDDGGFADFIIGNHVGRMPRSGRSTVNSSFAPKDLAEAVRGWTEEELNIIRQMGLSGLLLVDHFTHFNRDFSHFVMQCIDTENDRLVLGRGRFVHINEESFCRIIGARVGGAVEIERTTGSPSPREICEARAALGIPGHTEITTVELLHVLRSPRERPLTEADGSKLEVAYAMLAISVFFSPREKRGYVPRDAYRVGMRPNAIRNLNWGKYGREEFLDGAWMVQDANRRTNRGGTLFGCLIVGQIMYFDNLDVGDIAVDPSLEPRIEHYTASVLKSLIFRDTLLLPTEKIYGMFRGLASRDSLRMNAQVTQVRRPAARANRIAEATPSVARPLDTIDLAIMHGVHRHELPTIASILQDGNCEAPNDEYVAVFKMAGNLLRGGFSEFDIQSKNREANFYSELNLDDAVAPAKIETFDRREKVVRMQGLQYLLQQLVSRGVGNYIPSVVKHLDRINEIFNAVPGGGVPPHDVAGFMITSFGSQFVGGVDQVNKACMRRVDRHPVPTVASILHVNEDNPSAQQEYEAAVKNAKDWLKSGFAEVDKKSKIREDGFYQALDVNNVRASQMVEDFYQREKIVRLQGIQYLLNHLSERGVGKLVPSLEKHLCSVNSVLAGIPGVGAQVIDVADFIWTTLSEDVGLVGEFAAGGSSQGVQKTVASVRPNPLHGSCSVSGVKFAGAELDLIDQACMRGVHRHPVPTIPSILGIDGGNNAAIHPSAKQQYDELLLKVGDWLVYGFAKVDSKSNRREEIFYQKLNVNDVSAEQKVEEFDRRERVFRLQGVQYLLNHLSGCGVGKWITSIQEHSDSMNLVLAGLPLVGGRVLDVADFIGLGYMGPLSASTSSTSRHTVAGSGVLINPVGLAGSTTFAGGNTTVVLNPVPLRCVPGSLGFLSDAVNQLAIAPPVGDRNARAVVTTTPSIVHPVRCEGSPNSSPLEVLATTALSLSAGDVQGVGTDRQTPTHYRQYIPNSTGQNTPDLSMIGSGGSSSSRQDRGKAVCEAGVQPRQKKRSMRAILRAEESLEYIVYKATRKRGVGTSHVSGSVVAVSDREFGVAPTDGVTVTDLEMSESVVADLEMHSDANEEVTHAASMSHFAGELQVDALTSVVIPVPVSLPFDLNVEPMPGSEDDLNEDDWVVVDEQAADVDVDMAEANAAVVVVQDEQAEADVVVVVHEHAADVDVDMAEANAAVVVVQDEQAEADVVVVVHEHAADVNVDMAESNADVGPEQIDIGSVVVQVPLDQSGGASVVDESMGLSGEAVLPEISAVHYEPNYVLVMKKKVLNNVPGVCPLSYNFSFELPSSHRAGLGYWNLIVCRQADMPKLWVIHRVPKLLKMNGFDMLTEFHKLGSLGRRGFEIVRRLLSSVVNSWYSFDDRSRFSHCMPTRWMEIVADGGDHSTSRELREMFVGLDIEYDIETCHVIWLPHECDDGTYVLYGLDLDLQKVRVMDPIRTCETQEMLEITHRDMCERIIDGFVACADAFFDGWSFDKEDWGVEYHRNLNAPSSEANSVWFVVHYMMNYNGERIIETGNTAILVDLRTKLMMMVLNMAGNEGEAPEQVKNPDE